jgi:predicted membrane GTPase involved in stress response
LVVDEVLDLFIELEANDEQLDFPVVYASAVNGTARSNNATWNCSGSSLLSIGAGT